MRRKLSAISSILFIISVVAYLTMLFGNDSLLFVGVLISVVGLVIALFSESGIYKKIGLIGNGFIIFITIIIPTIVTTFFWNTP
ncbi:hypothetical protein [Guptibacillus spartinae]|uniref:hypothetical protein n=1 Tax=Guptibacillus spartinae TaxID=3025679 RepID=UPI00235F03AF|nr:hypothetical protein [Pseudalkalibacillus spartinae]